jgi:uncharacterized membrane protein
MTPLLWRALWLFVALVLVALAQGLSRYAAPDWRALAAVAGLGVACIWLPVALMRWARRRRERRGHAANDDVY